MPSPFPGMDPFIEQQYWEGFHTRFVTALGKPDLWIRIMNRLRERSTAEDQHEQC